MVMSNCSRQSTPESVGDILSQVGLTLPVKEIAKNLKRLLPDEASHAIKSADVTQLSMETVSAALKIMRLDAVSN